MNEQLIKDYNNGLHDWKILSENYDLPIRKIKEIVRTANGTKFTHPDVQALYTRLKDQPRMVWCMEIRKYVETKFRSSFKGVKYTKAFFNDDEKHTTSEVLAYFLTNEATRLASTIISFNDYIHNGDYTQFEYYAAKSSTRLEAVLTDLNHVLITVEYEINYGEY